MDNLPVTIETLPGQFDAQAVMTLRGPLTLANLFTFQQAVRAEKSPTLILDFGAVPYMDSAGLGSVVNAHVSRSNSGRQLALAAVSDRVLSLLHMSRVDQVLRIFPSVDSAQETLSK